MSITSQPVRIFLQQFITGVVLPLVAVEKQITVAPFDLGAGFLALAIDLLQSRICFGWIL